MSCTCAPQQGPGPVLYCPVEAGSLLFLKASWKYSSSPVISTQCQEEPADTGCAWGLTGGQVSERKGKEKTLGSMRPKWVPCIKHTAIAAVGLCCLPWGSRSWSYVTPSLGRTWIFRERKGKTQSAHHLLPLHCTSETGQQMGDGARKSALQPGVCLNVFCDSI